MIILCGHLLLFTFLIFPLCLYRLSFLPARESAAAVAGGVQVTWHCASRGRHCQLIASERSVWLGPVSTETFTSFACHLHVTSRSAGSTAWPNKEAGTWQGMEHVRSNSRDLQDNDLADYDLDLQREDMPRTPTNERRGKMTTL